MAKKKKKLEKTWRYDDDFKQKVIDHVNKGYKVYPTAALYKLNPKTVKRWVDEAKLIKIINEDIEELPDNIPDLKELAKKTILEKAITIGRNVHKANDLANISKALSDIIKGDSIEEPPGDKPKKSATEIVEEYLQKQSKIAQA